MEKQTIQFNGQEREVEEITLSDFLNIDENVIEINEWKSGGVEHHYYRLVPPPEVFPKIFGRYKVEETGWIWFEDKEEHLGVMIYDSDISNLKLALAESERIRRKE